jgi:hypothetical protein
MKFILISVFSLVSLMTFSQVSLKKLDGTVINNGDVLNFSQNTDPDSYLGLKIYNSASTDILVQIKVVSVVNSDATNLQLCINPVCVSNLITGASYPSGGSVIPANGQNGNLDHFLNNNGGIIANQNVDYTFKLFMIDENEVEIGNSITFTYRYTPNLSTSDFNQLAAIGVQLKSTVVTNALEFNSNAAIVTSIYDLNGKVVVSTESTSGNQTIDASNLSASIYFARFTTLKGKHKTIKFVKK